MIRSRIQNAGTHKNICEAEAYAENMNVITFSHLRIRSSTGFSHSYSMPKSV